MVGDLSTEVVHCPNCKEDVPKTLYCLNCGYPLYKIEQKKVDLAEPEPEILEVLAPKGETDIEVEIEHPSEPIVIEEEPAPVVEEPLQEVTIEVEETEDDVFEEPEIIEEIIEVEEPEIIDEPGIIEERTEVEEPATVEPVGEPIHSLDDEAQADMVETLEPDEITAPDITEEELMPELEEEPVITPEEDIHQLTEEPIPEQHEPLEELVEEPVPILAPEPLTAIKEQERMEDMRIEFAPDPLTKEVMDNLAKNITLKIRLVKLLRENQVKEETFKKLFDSYVDQGKIWVSRRDEIVKRFKADIDRMENALVTARKDHELLEIRKSIGDADDEEYRVKAPAYKWDIEHLEIEIKNRKGGITYVTNLKKLVPGDEIAELERMAETDYSELDTVENITQETVTKMKEALIEALKSLQT